ncbi:FG-GAP-like repeat-containing protein [Cellulophaga sp. Hel_I_12]|uniref:FG-GAP-like repeat-containing protein n=1 Tax=Cellulophaga sp. Hel_I_12 TaxID=1249972 RepID=UPI00068D36AE|nr:FG-GAP-like repeat-containing protein [Cellulophaga sp. Hel_I_12]
MNKNLLLVLGLIYTSFSFGQKAVNPLDEFTYSPLKTIATSNETRQLGDNLNALDGIDMNSLMRGASSSGIGETAGDLSVSLTGGASYNVPIAVPPGINGVVPSISISYNSQAGNGLAGFGWNISGVSVITRIPSTKFHDGNIDPVDFNSFDRFSFDGQRLLLKSGTYGGNNAEYQTENYSNVRIMSYGVSPYGASYGPSYFVINYPDGSVAYYGNSSDSKSRTDYAITYWENPQGVRISYTYVLADNSLSISRIKYGSRLTLSPLNEIQFVYLPRKRPEQAYIGSNSFIRKNLLKEIKVLTGSTGYKNYILSHTQTSLGYDRLISVQEKNGDNTLSYTPITFNYNTTPATITNDRNIVTELGIGNIEQRNAETVSLDLTGDGRMDFIVYPKASNLKTKFWVFKELQSGSFNYPITVNSGAFEAIFPVSFLFWNDKISTGQGLSIIQKSTTANQIKFKVYANGISSPITYQYEKVWNAPTYSENSYCDQPTQTNLIPLQYISGDFNGDGLSDVIAVNKPYSYQQCIQSLPLPGQDCGGGGELPQAQRKDSTQIVNSTTEIAAFSSLDCCECNIATASYAQVHFINLDRRLTTNFAKSIGSLIGGLKSTDQLMGMDMNGDGRTDVVHLTEGKINVYTLNSLDNLVLLWQTTDTRIKMIYQPMVGDYNGDGKIDFMYPTANNSSLFALFLSTGSSLIKTENTYPFVYKLSSLSSTTYTYTLIPVDANGDGKTDIVDYRTTTYNNSLNGTQTLVLYNNTFSTSSIGLPAFSTTTTRTLTGNLAHLPIPIFLSADKPNSNLNFASISNNLITSFAFNQDNREDMLMRSVNNNGLTYGITYKNLDPSELGHDYSPVYTKGYDQVYPYADIEAVLGVKVVSQLQRISSGTPTLNQYFNYSGAVSNVEGLGFIGFQGVARSNWNTDYNDIIWSISKHDMTLRTAVTSSYSMLSYPSFTVPSSGYISKTTYTYSSSLLSNKVFKISNSLMVTQNALENTVTTESFLYDSYNNVTKSTTDFSGQGNTVIDITYANATAPYFIGRPLTKVETNTINGNTFSMEEQYTYNNSLVTSKKVKGNGTTFDIETYLYDSFGNMTRKTVTPNGETSRIVNYEYDTSGRYLTKTTDVEGLITLFEYNTTTGTLKKETNPYGLITNYLYDGWNRLITVTDYLGKNANTTYVESGYSYTVTVSADDGASAIKVYDPLRRLTTEKSKDVLGQWISKSYQYDKFDRVWKESEPYIGSPTQWNITEFDVYNRPTKLTSYTGKITNITYSNLSTTVNDGTKTVTTVKNATGQISQVTDPGGTINYTYYGNGAMKTANYDGVILTTEQDGWGRKTKTTDPAAGTYTYTYNGFDEILTETTPKGTTTYTYSAVGKLTQKSIVGDLTNMTINYVYDATSKLLTGMTLVTTDGNNSSYAYTYDNFKRLLTTTETNPYAQFTKTLTYDTFGKVATEKSDSKLLVNNKVSSKTIKNNYQFGGLKSITDNSTLEVLWNVTALNGRGQVTSSTMGTNLRKNYTYDTNGYLTQFKSEKNINATPVALMTLGFNFDAQKGLLNSRTNSLFSWNETFTYDNLDRLVNFNDNNGAKNHTYDTQGRITANSNLGTYSYTGKSYQLANLTLNAPGQALYASTTRQDITYTAFKSPVEINEAGKEKINFQYNAALGRANMFYGDTNNDKLLRPLRKHYSADGSMEITYEKNNGKTTFVTYIGGDAYASPVIWRSEHSSTISEQYLYLHRDYLGSILGITDKDGNFKEKRHFDAWGNLVKLTDGNNMALTKFAIFDRGYTGHEHLQGVGLVHMNGRLYDPVIHRFLMPDNYVQDPYNTQNYNRYSYVMNNPLSYTDPSGEFFLEAIAVWKIIGLIGSALIVGGSFLKQYLDYKSDQKSASVPTAPGMSNPNNSQNIASSTSNPPETFNTDVPYGIKNSLSWLNQFQMGALKGFSSGLQSSWNFAKSLTTSEGWSNVGQGFVDLADMGNAFSIRGMQLRTDMALSAENFISRIPDMSPAEMGYYYGYAGEKAVEAVLLSKGTSVALNGLRGTTLVTNAAKSAVNYSDDLVKAAQKIYPKKAGKTELHHITPKYLGGAKNGALVPLDGAYHQVITNEFRALWSYGKNVPSSTELQKIMKQVYTKYPLPPGY